eukprot:5419746-Alexandrium_andersonii.AAC.1
MSCLCGVAGDLAMDLSNLCKQAPAFLLLFILVEPLTGLPFSMGKRISMPLLEGGVHEVAACVAVLRKCMNR